MIRNAWEPPGAGYADGGILWVENGLLMYQGPTGQAVILAGP